MGLLLGLSSILRGVLRLASTPALWVYAIGPVVAAFALLLVLAFVVKGVAVEPLIARLREELGGAQWTDAVVTVVFWLLFAAFLVFAFSATVRIVAAPFLALLVERTVRELSGAPAPAAPGGRIVRWFARPVVEAIALLGLRLAATVAALPLLLIPAAGPLVFGVVMASLVGVDLLDLALSGRGIVLAARLRWIARNPLACVGLGAGAALLLLVPCVNALLLPGIVVGAVLLDRSLSPDFPRAAVTA